MPTIIRIKRSPTAGNPSTLALGELAYSSADYNAVAGGGRLYIGSGTETNGNASERVIIGGKYFTDMLDHAMGVLTANSAIVTDANKKIDNLIVDNIDLNGNTVSSTTGSLILVPATTLSINNAYTIPKTDGTNGQALVTNGSGTVSFTSIPYSLNLTADSTNGTLVILNANLAVLGGEGIDTTVTANAITISAEDASSTNKGVAAFATRDFTVTTGNVVLSNVVTGTTLGSSGSAESIKNYQIQFNDQGRITSYLTWTDIPLFYTLKGDTGTSKAVTGGNVTFTGGEGIDTTVTSGNVITIDAELATYNNKGVAEFNANSFTVTSGNVELATVNSNTGSFGSATNVPVISVDAKGRLTAVSTAAIVTNFTIAANVGTSQLFNNGNTLLIAGDATQGTSTTVTSNRIIVTVGDATTTQKGVASFNTNNFTVSSGAVSTKAVTIGTTAIHAGSSSTTIAGLTQVDVNNIRLTGSTISTTDTNGDLIIDPNGTGNVNVNSSRIINVTDPVNPQDAATKAYVDAVKTGLDVKESVRAATTGNIVLSGTQTIDGVSVIAGNRVLVKDQSTGSQNGIYVVAAGAWARATDADNTPGSEVTSGMFTFVEEGTVNADSGWVLTTNDPITIGSTSLSFAQFSGAGQITAGAGLTKSGNTIDVVGTSNRITVNADSIDIASTYVGQTSINTLGTISTGIWNGTTIAATYGGTGHATFAVGDILVAGTTTALSRLAVSATAGKVLQSDGTTLVYGDVDGGTY